MPVYPIRYASFPIEPSPAFPDGRIAHRPLLRVALVHENRFLDCYSLVDSGADFCSFPLSFAQALGFDMASGVMDISSGMGSEYVPTRYWPVGLDLQGIARFEVYAGFTTGLEAWGIGLLGQSGFFDRFKISFDHASGLYYIEAPGTAISG